MMNRKHLGKAGLMLAAGMLLAAVGVGCKSMSDKFQSCVRDLPAPLSDFLPHHEQLTLQPDTFPFHYFYLRRQTKRYERIHIETVDTSRLQSSGIWSDLDQALANKLGNDIKELAHYARAAYIDAFKNSESEAHLKVTDNTHLPNTLILEAAIVALQPTKAEVNAAGVVTSLYVPIPGIGLIFSAFGEGSITIECRIRDAETGQIVAMYADTESDPKAILSFTQFTWTNSARINIKEMAMDTARVLAAKDYHQIERKFPVQWTSFPCDADLGEKQ